MVEEAGSISIVGTIDVASIKAGLAQVKHGLSEAKDSAKTAMGDIGSLAGAFGGLGTKLMGVGIAAATATVGLASMGPAVAPAMARMKRSMFEVTRTVSDALAPSFELFADVVQDFANWLGSSDGQDLLNFINGAFEGGISGISEWGKSFGEVVANVKKLYELLNPPGESKDDTPPPTVLTEEQKSQNFRNNLRETGKDAFPIYHLFNDPNKLIEMGQDIVKDWETFGSMISSFFEDGVNNNKSMSSSINPNKWFNSYNSVNDFNDDLNTISNQKYKHMETG